MGYTPQILTGVWTGRDIPTSMGRRETGSHAALPIWLMAMQAFHKNRPKLNFAAPQGIEWVAVDPKTGLLPGPDSKGSFLESFRIGTAPTESGQGEGSHPQTGEKKKDFFDLGL
ncbi:MAG: hypothetical protein Q9M30_07900 [Mariprofundaceae bacterium]|nr:hypothetical protein [Mariprofundaceae bacterium]